LNADSKGLEMSVELRHVQGNGLWLGSERIEHLVATLHHVRLNRLVVDAATGEGSVNLEKTRINRIDNHSLIPIMRRIRGHRRKCA
jgi:hypothetical protein